MTGALVIRERDPGLLDQLGAADPRLQIVVYLAAVYSFELFSRTPLLTCVKRDHAQTLALHGAGAPASPHESDPCRAADLRTRGYLTDAEAESWAARINQHLEYSPSSSSHVYPVALYETQSKMLEHGRDPNLPPVVPHLHVQVPPWLIPGPVVVRLWTVGPA